MGIIGNILFSVIGKIVFGISYIISAIFGIGIAIEAWIIGAILGFNTQIVNSTPVKVGFPVALSIANLGFVLAIIVIAIATIIRLQTYAIKQTLWKLVVAAVLVNFSLTIAGAILGFADNLSFYFLGGVNPAESVGGATNGLASFNNFASALAGAFNPQRGFIAINKLSAVNSTDLQKIQGGFAPTNTLGVKAGSSLGELIAPITSLVFVVVALIAIALVLLALIVMLIIRYVFLGILLILMPFAWVSWIFPALKGNWEKWWHHFIRWTFFAPIVIFFLWLGIQTSYEMDKGASGTYNFAVYTSNSNVFWGAIINSFTNIFSPIVQNLLQMAILVGIMLGGLFAANSLGITFASTAMGWAKGMGGYVGGRIGGMATRAATRPLRGGVGRGLTAGLQRFRTGLENVGANRGRFGRLLTAPVRGFGTAVGAPVRWAGRGLETLAVQGGAKQVEEARRRLLSRTHDQIEHGIGSTFTEPENIAGMQILMEGGGLDRLNKEGNGLHQFLDEKLFKRYDQELPLYRDLNISFLSDPEVREAILKGDEKTALQAMIKYAAQPTISDISKTKQMNDLFSGNYSKGFGGFKDKSAEILEKIQILGTAIGGAQLVPVIVNKLHGRSLDHMDKKFREVVEDAIKDPGKLGLTADQAKKLKKSLEDFGEIAKINALGGYGVGAAVTSTAASSGGATTGGGAHTP